MEWTLGNILFFGGIAGMGLTILAAVILMVSMRRSRSRLYAKFNEEYGNRKSIK